MWITIIRMNERERRRPNRSPNFKKLLHHFNGAKSSFTRGTSLTSSQSRSSMKSSGTVMKNVHSRKRIEGGRTVASASGTRSRTIVGYSSSREPNANLLPFAFTIDVVRSDAHLDPTFSSSNEKNHRRKATFRRRCPTRISPFPRPITNSFRWANLNFRRWSNLKRGRRPATWPVPRPRRPRNRRVRADRSSKKILHDDQKYGIARNWLYDEMFKLLKATTKPGLVLLSRSSGMGKTRLLKNLVSPPASTSMSLQRSDSTSISPRQFDETFGFRLAEISQFFRHTSAIARRSVRVRYPTWFIRSFIGHLNILFFMLTETWSYANNTLEKRSPWMRVSKMLNMPSSPVKVFITLVRLHSFFFPSAFLDQLNQLKQLGHLQEFFAHSNHVYLLLDAIDHEQCDSEGATITEFLFTNLHRFPPWLKLIITMNRLDNDQCQAEENRFLQNFVLFDLDDQGRWNSFLHNDIREYLSKRLEVSLRENSVRLVPSSFR